MSSPAAVQPEASPSHATVFVWVFALSAIWHYTSSPTEIYDYWFHFDPLGTPLFALAILSAFSAAVFPNRILALLIFSCGQIAAIFLRLPFVADHLVMELGVHVAIISSIAYLAVRNQSLNYSVDAVFQLFSPVGRWLLIIMYFFGTFHKINPGFLTPASSCAIPFIEGLPIPAGIAALPITQYAAIYGTLVLEFLAMLLLLSARTKYWGMLLGMSFHFVIGISSFGTLAHFSAFALALHTLFLPSTFGERLAADSAVPKWLKSADSFKILTVGIVTLQLAFAAHLFVTRQGYLVNTLFSLFAILLMALVARHGKIRPSDRPYRLRAPLLALNVVPVWFFLHCMSPYLGLGTGGALAMFSGLRTEGGTSNHHVLTRPLELFGYQRQIVYVEAAENPSLNAAVLERQGLVLFDFQRHFTELEDLVLPITLRVGEDRRTIDDEASLRGFVEDYFEPQSWLERKYMSFRLVDEPRPNRCRH